MQNDFMCTTQGSFLCPILVNIFLNYLATTVQNSEISNFADDNFFNSKRESKNTN